MKKQKNGLNYLIIKTKNFTREKSGSILSVGWFVQGIVQLEIN